MSNKKAEGVSGSAVLPRLLPGFCLIRARRIEAIFLRKDDEFADQGRELARYVIHHCRLG